MGLLEGKTVLVTGVGLGMGRSVVENALNEGANVIMGDLQEEQLFEIQSELDSSKDRTLAKKFDLMNEESCQSLIEDGVKKFGQLDGIIQVAAYDSAMGGLMDGDLDDWDKVSAINIKGTLQLVKAAVPHLEKDGGGSVVIVGSTSAAVPSDDFPQMVYGISKGALETATHYLATELGPRGIRVNDVAPGFKWGPVLEQAFQEQADKYGLTLDEVTQPVKDKMLLRRFASDDDNAKACVFFCSDYAKNITGQTLYVDAGYVLH